jgi:hypothetical protein
VDVTSCCLVRGGIFCFSFQSRNYFCLNMETVHFCFLPNSTFLLPSKQYISASFQTLLLTKESADFHSQEVDIRNSNRYEHLKPNNACENFTSFTDVMCILHCTYVISCKNCPTPSFTRTGNAKFDRRCTSVLSDRKKCTFNTNLWLRACK